MKGTTKHSRRGRLARVQERAARVALEQRADQRTRWKIKAMEVEKEAMAERVAAAEKKTVTMTAKAAGAKRARKRKRAAKRTTKAAKRTTKAAKKAARNKKRMDLEASVAEKQRAVEAARLDAAVAEKKAAAWEKECTELRALLSKMRQGTDRALAIIAPEAVFTPKAKAHLAWQKATVASRDKENQPLSAEEWSDEEEWSDADGWQEELKEWQIREEKLKAWERKDQARAHKTARERKAARERKQPAKKRRKGLDGNTTAPSLRFLMPGTDGSDDSDLGIVDSMDGNESDSSYTLVSVSWSDE